MNRLRPPTLLVIAAAVVVVGGVAAAWLVPPLGTGSAGGAFGPPGVDLTTDSRTGAAVITYRPLGQVGWGVEVRNATFLPVTIDGLTGGPQPYPIEVRLVLGTFPDCPDARPNWTTGTGATISTLRLDVRVAGVLPVEAEVRLLQAVELSGDSDAACP